MLSETALMNCDNLPEIMRDKFDQPWKFVGEIRGTPCSIHSVCRCSIPKLNFRNDDEKVPPCDFGVVECDG